MNFSYRYRAEDSAVELPAADYVARFRDAQRIAEYCRACPSYGSSWGCPPFGFSVEEYLSGYATALVVATKIVPEQEGLPLSEAGRLMRSFAYVGTCLHCPEGSCTRPDGNPCRHPDRVRPSLEACGFDVGRTARELFGIELKWGVEGRMPEYLTLVCGFFHNAGHIVWNG